MRKNYKKTWKENKRKLNFWNKKSLSLLGRIAVIKMMILPKMLFLFQMLPLIYKDQTFEHWHKDINKFIWQRKIPRIRLKILQDSKDRGGLGVPNLRLYFEACCFTWLKEWVLLENDELLELESDGIYFGWHVFLGYGKIKANRNFSTHCIRRSLLRVWNKYKRTVMPKFPSWFSPQEAIHRREMGQQSEWLTYGKVIITERNKEYKIKPPENLIKEGFKIDWFGYRQLVSLWLFIANEDSGRTHPALTTSVLMTKKANPG